jgi:hypothetical protein
VLPAPLHEQPEQTVEDAHQRFPRPPEPAAERRGVRNAQPAEQAPHAAGSQQREIVHHAAAIQQQHRPHLDHQARPETSRLRRGLAVQPLPDTHLIPEPPDQQQSAAVCQLTAAVSHPQRSGATLNMRPGFDMMDSHRLGVSCCEEPSAKKSLQHKAPDGVSHHIIASRLQDPG